MRNYHRENVARYREMTDRGVSAWAHSQYGGTDYAAMYDDARHRPDRQVVERGTGRVFDGYDDDCLYDPDTDVCYWPYDGEAEIDDAITVDGARFFPAPALSQRSAAAKGSRVLRLRGTPPDGRVG